MLPPAKLLGYVFQIVGLRGFLIRRQLFKLILELVEIGRQLIVVALGSGWHFG